MLYAVVLLMDNKLDCLDLRSEVNLLLVSSGLIFTTGHFLGLEGSLSSFPCDVHVGLGSVLDSGMMFLNLLLDGLLQLLDIDLSTRLLDKLLFDFSFLFNFSSSLSRRLASGQLLLPLSAPDIRVLHYR